MAKKTVLRPIEVPVGKYCWAFDTHSSELCEYFSNEGGHSTCDLDFWDVKDTKEGVLKPKECLNLKTEK